MTRRALGVLLLALAASCGPEGEAPVLTLATTTSLQDSGLLDELLPRFARETGIRVHVVAVGTGAALRMGSEGNADVLLTHAPSAELELVASGAVMARVPIMENHFVIAGPEDDPAGVANAASAVAALQRIRSSEARWVSRGDDSGTHQRERQLWRVAGLDPDETWDGFTSTGSGMGLTLQVAAERRAYLLADIGTFLAFRERTGLRTLSRPEPELRNEYSLLLVNPERFPGRIRAGAARSLESFLLRADVQRQIEAFGLERFGAALFRPLPREGDHG